MRLTIDLEDTGVGVSMTKETTEKVATMQFVLVDTYLHVGKEMGLPAEVLLQVFMDRASVAFPEDSELRKVAMYTDLQLPISYNVDLSDCHFNKVKHAN